MSDSQPQNVEEEDLKKRENDRTETKKKTSSEKNQYAEMFRPNAERAREPNPQPVKENLKSTSDVENEINKKRYPYPKPSNVPPMQTMFQQSPGS